MPRGKASAEETPMRLTRSRSRALSQTPGDRIRASQTPARDEKSSKHVNPHWGRHSVCTNTMIFVLDVVRRKYFPAEPCSRIIF